MVKKNEATLILITKKSTSISFVTWVIHNKINRERLFMAVINDLLSSRSAFL
jgi:hypothetical protein